MMDLNISLALSLFIPTLTGSAILTLLFFRESLPRAVHCALSYGLGLGILTIWMLILGMAGIKFSLGAIGLPLLAFSCTTFIVSLLQREKLFTKNQKILRKGLLKIMTGWSWGRCVNVVFGLILLFYITRNFLFVFWRAMNTPIIEWDAIATVAFKAKIFFYEQSLPDLNLLPHPTYPLFVPFAETWVALNLGYWSDQFIKIIFPCALLSYLVIFYYFLARWTNRLWALLGCAVLLSANFFIYHATLSYNDFFLMYFNTTTILLLLEWSRSRNRGMLILAGIFAGLASFTKLEGTSFLLVYFILLTAMVFVLAARTSKEKIMDLLRFALPSAGTCAIYHAYKFLHHATKDGTGTLDKTGIDFSMVKITLVPEILKSFTENLFFSGNWNIVWFLAVLSCAHLVRKGRDLLVRYVLLSVILFFGLYGAVALLTVNYVWIAGESHTTTLSRLILHFYPLAVVLIILLNFPKNPGGIKTPIPGNR